MRESAEQRFVAAKSIGGGKTMAAGLTKVGIMMMSIVLAAPISAQKADDAAAPVPATEAVSVQTADTRRIRLMVMREVNSSKAKAGDVVKLIVDQSFDVDGIIVPAGTPAFGTVREAKDGGAALQRGKLEVSLTHIAIGDRHLPLRGDVLDKGEGGKADDAAKVLLAPIYILFARGNVAKLRAGEIVYAELLPPKAS